MKKVILLSLMLVCFVGYSQNDEKEDKTIYILVDRIPEYSDGGEEGLRKHIMRNFRVPNLKKTIKGEIITEFIVETDGSISDIKIIQDLGYGLGDEVVRVLKRAKKWTPAIKNNKYVRYKNVFPLKLNLEVK